MATFYIDPVSGNNNYGGDSWAVTLTATDGVTNGTTTFTSATGGFTLAMVGRYIYINTTTPFWGTIVGYTNTNTITLSGSPATQSGRTFTVGGAWADGTSGPTAARIAPNDTIRCAKSPDATSVGNATWTNLSTTVTLASAKTKNISLCQAGWTASANVTSSTSADRKQGTVATTIVPAAAFTTGVLAYEAMASTDFSAYQQISFWIKSTITIPANNLQIQLCTNNNGTGAVDSLTVPYQIEANAWHVFTVDKGSALSSGIQSVALNALVDFGACTMTIDNILACLAPAATGCLTLNSVISKYNNQIGATWGTTESWYPIMSINDTAVILSNQNTLGFGSERGYWGTTETVTTYARNVTIPTLLPTSNTYWWTIPDSGTAGNLITYSGGWNTSSNLQDGMSFYDLVYGGAAGGMIINGRAYIAVERLVFLRSSLGHFPTSSAVVSYTDCGGLACGTATQGGTANSDITYTRFYGNNCNTGLSVGGDRNYVTDFYADNSAGSAFAPSGATNGTLTNLLGRNCGSVAIYTSTTANTFCNNVKTDGSLYAFGNQGQINTLYFNNSEFLGGGTANFYSAGNGEVVLWNCNRYGGVETPTITSTTRDLTNYREHQVYQESNRHLVNQFGSFNNASYLVGYMGTEETSGGNSGMTLSANSYMTAANESQFDFEANQAWSVSTWVKNTTWGGTQFVFSKRVSGGSNGGLMMYYDGYLNVRLYSNTNASNLIAFRKLFNTSYAPGGTPTTLLANVWYNIVVTYDGSRSRSGIKVYVNNVEIINDDSVADSLGTDSILTNVPFQLGGWGNGTTNYCTATYNQTAVFNRVLNSTEVSTVWNSGKGKYPLTADSPYNSGLVALWRGQEGNGTSIADISGNSNTITVNGTGYAWGVGKRVALQPAVAGRGSTDRPICLTPVRTETALPLKWVFYLPVTSGVDPQLKFYMKKSAGFNGSATLTVYDNDTSTKLINAATITPTTSWTQYSATSITPSKTGRIRCEIRVLSGGAWGCVDFTDFSSVYQGRTFTDDLSSWTDGLPSMDIGTPLGSSAPTILSGCYLN